MTTENICPFCGGPLENVTNNTCPSCGSAIPASVSGAATIISPRSSLDNSAATIVNPRSSLDNSSATILSPRSSFNSSAEVMDEVKRLERNGDSGAAAQILGTEFGLDQAAAQQTAEQVQIELQHDGREAFSSGSEAQNSFSRPEVIDAPGYESVKKPSNNRNWIIGGSIGAAVFLCCCCCLPLISVLMRMRGR